MQCEKRTCCEHENNSPQNAVVSCLWKVHESPSKSESSPPPPQQNKSTTFCDLVAPVFIPLFSFLADVKFFFPDWKIPQNMTFMYMIA